MNVNVIHETKHVARKQYKDDARDFIVNYFTSPEDFEDLEEDETELIKRIILGEYKHIEIGSPYIRQWSTCEGGDPYTFRANEVTMNLCCDFDLFDSQL